LAKVTKPFEIENFDEMKYRVSTKVLPLFKISKNGG